MPGRSFRGPPPPLSLRQDARAQRLRVSVETLALEIGPRHSDDYAALSRAAAWIEEALSASGSVRRDRYRIGREPFDNLVVEVAGTTRPDQLVVVGAHYDTVPESPGANDNGTGVAALLELARAFGRERPPSPRTLRLVAFVNEEMPHFAQRTMGSQVHAHRARLAGDDIVAAVSLETIGCYLDRPGSQRYPFRAMSLVYPTAGDFLAFVGNRRSRSLVRHCVRTFRESALLPCEGGALPEAVPGVSWSDHASFWSAGYRGLMITDTAPFRDPHYHRATDTPDHIDFPRLTWAVDGIEDVVASLLDSPRRWD